MFVEISIVNTHSAFTIFLNYKDWVCQPIWVRDFSVKTSGEELVYFYPNILLSILREAAEPLLDGSRLLVEIKGVLSLLPRDSWHEDVPVVLEQGGERAFLCWGEAGPDHGGLVRLIIPEDNGLGHHGWREL